MLIVVCVEVEDQSRSKKRQTLPTPNLRAISETAFCRFQKKGINYCHQKDFNGPGEFHAVLVRLWNEEREKDKTFATGIQTATFDFDADKKSTRGLPE